MRVGACSAAARGSDCLCSPFLAVLARTILLQHLVLVDC